MGTETINRLQAHLVILDEEGGHDELFKKETDVPSAVDGVPGCNCDLGKTHVPPWRRTTEAITRSGN